jgi:hypothetical protein
MLTASESGRSWKLPCIVSTRLQAHDRSRRDNVAVIGPGWAGRASSSYYANTPMCFLFPPSVQHNKEICLYLLKN